MSTKEKPVEKPVENDVVVWKDLTYTKWKPKPTESVEGVLEDVIIREGNMSGKDGVVSRYAHYMVRKPDGEGILVSGAVLNPLLTYKLPFAIKLTFNGTGKSQKGFSFTDISVKVDTKAQRFSTRQEAVEHILSKRAVDLDAWINEALTEGFSAIESGNQSVASIPETAATSK